MGWEEDLRIPQLRLAQQVEQEIRKICETSVESSRKLQEQEASLSFLSLQFDLAWTKRGSSSAQLSLAN